MMHLLKSYAWLIGDGALFAFAIFELISLREPRRKEGDERKPK